jgi:hypothetical protein
MTTEWLFPADTVQGRADRHHVDLRQRTLAEFADGSTAFPEDAARRAAADRHTAGPPSATADA